MFLPQAHFVSQDAVEIPLVHGDEPVETDVLILPERVLQQKWDFGLDTRRVQSVACRLKGGRHLYHILKQKLEV